jgi:hypothetical protein
MMQLSTTFILAGVLASALTVAGPIGKAVADNDNDGRKRQTKHHFCYDKHGHRRAHPHCPPQHPHYSRYHRPGEHYHGRPHGYRYSRDRHPRRPQVTYVRKGSPYDYRGRYSEPTARNDVRHARKEVQQSREQLRKDYSELQKDRAELRRDIRNGASREEIRKDRQEIRADLQKIKTTRRDLRNDRANLDDARREQRR